MKHVDRRIQKISSGKSGKKVGYKGTFCNGSKCSKYSIPKKYDELALFKPPQEKIYISEKICPYFIAKLNNKDVLIDKGNNNLLGEYDYFQLMNTVPYEHFYYNFFKVKKKMGNMGFTD